MRSIYYIVFNISFILFLQNSVNAESTINDSCLFNRNHQLSIGSGFNYILKQQPKYLTYVYNYTETSYPPLYIKYEKQFSKHLCQVIELNYCYIKRNFNHTTYYYTLGQDPSLQTFNDISRLHSLVLTYGLHILFPIKQHALFYIGMGLGLNIHSHRLMTSETNVEVLNWLKDSFRRPILLPAANLTCGLQVHLYKHIGAFAEIGLDRTLFQFGVYQTLTNKYEKK
jgi:hypothetical protein